MMWNWRKTLIYVSVRGSRRKERVNVIACAYVINELHNLSFFSTIYAFSVLTALELRFIVFFGWMLISINMLSRQVQQVLTPKIHLSGL